MEPGGAQVAAIIGQNRRRRVVFWRIIKCLVIGTLGALVLCFWAVTLRLEAQIAALQEKAATATAAAAAAKKAEESAADSAQSLMAPPGDHLDDQINDPTVNNELLPDPTTPTTIRHSTPLDAQSLHRHRGKLADSGTSHVTVAAAYWQQAVTLLAPWDGTLNQDDVFLTNDVNVTNAWHALYQAAQLGHADAQYHLGNILAAGVFWPSTEQPKSSFLLSLSPIFQDLTVTDEWLPPHAPQSARAVLYWHQAAMGGQVEAMTTLADYHQHLTLASRSVPHACNERLLYLAAAADATIDALQTHAQFRGKLVPAKDQHGLHQIHLHGHSQGKLGKDDKADESSEALQFYHVRAQGSSTAAYFLANLYQYGWRGVPQNTTRALDYYVRAANQGHWEAAGQAGKLYLWGMGVPQNVLLAHKMFSIGTPFGLEGCLRHQQLKMRKTSDQVMSADVHMCEAACLNGMGLLRLLGVPMIVSINADQAEQYFLLAKEQGSMDAAYNLAMMKLGWQTHFVPLTALAEEGQSLVTDQMFGSVSKQSPTRQEFQSILTDLTTAAGKGHVQARHRLGHMYTQGVSLPVADSSNGGAASSEVVVPVDCERATAHFQWIVDHASVPRATRMRTAYKQFMAGETAHALRNYYAAAQAGSELAQLNAAFLLEQGECLGLSKTDCAKAAVRLYKAAAVRGDSSEASLRVGDFYYYQRLREKRDLLAMGPFGWMEYVIRPDELLPQLWTGWRERFVAWLAKEEDKPEEGEEKAEVGAATGAQSAQVDEMMCSADSRDVCYSARKDEPSVEDDLVTAAEYYRIAADHQRASPRANFNLGFMYEWGLGLKQDLALAKRHYDLAIAGADREAEIPVAVALAAMRIHEYCVRQMMVSQEWKDKTQRFWENVAASARRRRPSTLGIIDPNGAHRGFGGRRTKVDILWDHFWSFESLLILILTALLWILLRRLQTRR